MKKDSFAQDAGKSPRWARIPAKRTSLSVRIARRKKRRIKMIEAIIGILNEPIPFSVVIVVMIFWFLLDLVRKQLRKDIIINCAIIAVYGPASYLGLLTYIFAVILIIPILLLGASADMLLEYFWKNKSKYPKCPKCGKEYQVGGYLRENLKEMVCVDCADKEKNN